MKVYAMLVWTDDGNYQEMLPYYSTSKEKLLAKYKEVLKKMYEQDGGEEETEYTLSEYAAAYFLADEDDIVELAEV